MKDSIKKIKSFILSNWLFLLLFIFIIVITTVKLPYDVEMPGGTIDLGDRVYVDGKKMDIDGTFNMAYVSVVEGSIPYIIMGALLPDWDVVPQSDMMYDNETSDQALKRDKLYLEQSIDYATVTAMDAAKIPYTINSIENNITYISKEARTSLEYGDKILTINGEKLTDYNVISDLIQKVDVGDTIKFEVLRDGNKTNAKAKVYEEKGKHYIGVQVITTLDFTSDVDVKIETKAAESGPSGGMMMALMVYNALTKQDLTKGRTIVGTGTISLDGKVGEIGGVKYKLMGAVNADADIFLVPKGNYEEAMDAKEEKGYDIEIVEVDTLQDAIDYLED